ncbi:hypothetical protein JRQ81_005031 [Phrynocephalus forsythii]|uniref:Neuronal PAS domain-containing protein 4-like n=1 Tax=Phrynocephalus forsythii TaxID=171643 RepID=A0A9Q1B6N4_9SAUR|nr:hypothetical protein JRQ81_005031 [Phrynocephalus forsythii]
MGELMFGNNVTCCIIVLLCIFKGEGEYKRRERLRTPGSASSDSGRGRRRRIIMTILCENCRKPVRRTKSCVSKCPATTSLRRRELRIPKPFRSTKGASKARRDQINAELQTLRSLLPVSEQEKERLSYLHTMALVCFHIRNTQLFHPGSSDLMEPGPPPAAAFAWVDPELLFSLPGFIVALTAHGKLAYISENVSDFLGYSVVELLAHGDTIFDLLNSSSCRAMEEKLHFAQEHIGTEIEFAAEMCTSRVFRARFGKNRAMALRGRFVARDTQLSPSSPALTFIAFCTPVASVLEDGENASQNPSFQSKHTLDMKIAEITESVIYHLGYQKEELIGQSWYHLLHPEDTGVAAEMHKALTYGTGRHDQRIVVRLLCKDLSWTWVQVSARKESGKAHEFIISTNHILRKEEAIYIRNQDSRHEAASPATSTERYCHGEINQHTTLEEVSLSLQEAVIGSNGRVNYHPFQPPNAVEGNLFPSPPQPPFPVSASMRDNAVTLPSSQEATFSSFFSAGFPFADGRDRPAAISPCVFCSTEAVLSPHSSPAADLSPLFEEKPTVGTRPDPDKWAINVLAGQIHALAEMFSQYTKPEPPSIPVGQPAEITHTAPGRVWETDGALDFLEELSVDEELITNFLNNLLHNERPEPAHL